MIAAVFLRQFCYKSTLSSLKGMVGEESLRGHKTWKPQRNDATSCFFFLLYLSLSIHKKVFPAARGNIIFILGLFEETHMYIAEVPT
jgi:hypothetical protein